MDSQRRDVALPPRRVGGPLRILVDVVHGKENNPFDFIHNQHNYLYYHVYSMYRLFRHLTQNGFEVGAHRRGPLTAEVLSHYDFLFMNLMHEAEPHFTADEIRAVHAWVANGGGLLVISEHTNTYHSSEKINPLIVPLGIEVTWTTALDSPEHCTNAPGWLLVRNLDSTHPLNAEVTTLHLLSGAALRLVDPEHCLRDADGRPPRARATAFTSADGWADKAGDGPPSFYGDGKRSPDDEQGAMPVVAVSEFGRGRVVVLGDQNMMGDAMLFFRHNFRHALNVFDWLSESARRGSAQSQPLRDTIPSGTLVGIDLRYRPLAAVKESADGLVGFYINLNRCAAVSGLAVSLGERELFPHLGASESGGVPLLTAGGGAALSAGMGMGGVDSLSSLSGLFDWSLVDDDRSLLLDALILPAPTVALHPNSLRLLQALLGRSALLVLLLDVDRLNQETLDLLALLAPDFNLALPPPPSSSSSYSSSSANSSSASITFGVSEPQQRAELLARSQKEVAKLPITVPHRLQSSEAGMQVEANYLVDYPLSQVRSEWGRPFLSTSQSEYNVALGSRAYQSSEFEARPCPATNAVDGDLLSYTHTSVHDRQPWLVIDLGRDTLLTTVVLYNRADISQIRLRDIRLELFEEKSARGAPCGASDCARAGTLRCLSCQSVRYCSRDCQRADWPQHKQRCRVASASLADHCPAFGAQVFASELLNPGNAMKSPAHILVPLTRSSSSPIRARFIRVSRVASEDPRLHPEDQCLLSLGQVVALSPVAVGAPSPGLYNAALQCASVTQSSTENQPAAHAVDGRVDTFTHTDSDQPGAWLHVDLGREVDVRLISLQNRMDGWMNRLRDISVELRNRRNEAVWLSSPLNPGNQLNGPSQINVHTRGGVQAQHVIVRRAPLSQSSEPNLSPGDRNVLSLVQLQVWVQPPAAIAVSVAAAAAPTSPSAATSAASVDALRGPFPPVDIARIGRARLPIAGPAAASSSSLSSSSSKSSSDSSSSSSASSATDSSSDPLDDNLIIFMQSSFWHNRFTSSVCDRRCRAHGELATRLQYSLVDFIVDRAERRRQREAQQQPQQPKQPQQPQHK